MRKSLETTNNIMPLVSIVTVCYNSVDTIEKTIQSVVSQTYDNVEYIIVDGGSTDGTVDIIKKYDKQIARWISEPDEGISDAFNKGIAMASGDWIELLNSGDMFFDNQIVSQLSDIVKRHPEFLIITGFSKFGKITIPKKKISNKSLLSKRALISHQASFVHRSVYDEVGYYDKSLKIRMDYDFWLRALKCRRFYFWDKILVDYAEGGLSGSDVRLFYREERIINKKRLSMYPFLNFVILLKLYCKLMMGGNHE